MIKMSKNLKSKSCFLDTGVFYRSTGQLGRLIEEGYSFYINIIVYYEFINTIESEINDAEQKRNIKRMQLLLTLKNKFSDLLAELNIILLNIPIVWNQTLTFLQKMKDYGMNIGDILILETIKIHDIDLIISTDKDWERTGIKSIIL